MGKTNRWITGELDHRSVFLRRELNEQADLATLIPSGREDLMAKALSPFYFIVDLGLTRKAAFSNLQACDGTRGVKRPEINRGQTLPGLLKREPKF